MSDVRQRHGPAEHAGGLTFDLVASKLRRPPARPGAVPRSSLIEKLKGEDSRPIVSVVAPAGYGKTTLLSQWAECNGQAFAWVSVDDRDNDPKVLLAYVARALDAVQPVGAWVFEALASPVSSVPGSVVPRLGTALASMTTPVALVLDDVHLLHDRECQSALSVLADHVPGRSRLVLAGRAEPPVRIARLRAEGRVLEIGPGDLSLTLAEAASLLAAAEVGLGEDEVAELHQRTEGWAVGLYLAALALRAGGSLGSAAVSFAGDDRLVSEYVESEFLARISPRQRVFLTQTSVLERMSGALVEAVLEWPGSAAALAGLARSNLLLVPLDRRGSGTATTTCSATCCWPSWSGWSRAWSRCCGGELPAGACAITCPRRRWNTSWLPGTSIPQPGWWKNSGCRSTGRPGSPPCSGGSGGWRSGAGSRGTRWPPRTPPISPGRSGGQPRPSGGPMWSIAGSPRTRTSPATLSPRRRPL